MTLEIPSLKAIKPCGGLTSDIAPFYVNPYSVFCAARCVYCWGGGDPRRFPHNSSWIKTDILKLLEADLEAGFRGNCWVGNFADSHQPVEKFRKLSRGCIELLKRYGCTVTSLTKFGLIRRDFDLLDSHDFVGVSLISLDEPWRRQLEPFGDSAKIRLEVVKEACLGGIGTFLNCEPVHRIEDFRDIYYWNLKNEYAQRLFVGKLNPRQKNRVPFPYPDYDLMRRQIEAEVEQAGVPVTFKSNWTAKEVLFR